MLFGNKYLNTDTQPEFDITDWRPSEYQEKWLRGIYSVVLILFCISLVFALFNVFAYVYPMQERSKLIFLFYGLVFVICTLHIAVYLNLVIRAEEENPYIYPEQGFDPFNLLEWLASCSMLALGWLITAIMY